MRVVGVCVPAALSDRPTSPSYLAVPPPRTELVWKGTLSEPFNAFDVIHHINPFMPYINRFLH